MQKGDSHYERIILIVAALVAVGVSGTLIYESLSFAEGLKPAHIGEKKDFGDIPVENVQNALAVLTAPFKPWVAPVRSNKPVPLDKSVLLVLKDDQIYDLFLEDKPLRPPMTNEYLRKHDLEYLSPNVGDLDPDGDNFTNQEEFLGGTDPRDPQSHPPITNKLFFVERISHDYIVVLKSSSAPYQVTITPPGKPRRGYFVEEAKGGAESKFGPDGRFGFVKFEAKKIPDARLGEKDVSELTIEDRVQKNQLVLVMNVEQNLAEYEAKFEFRLGSPYTFVVPKDGEFRLKGHEETTYKVIDIQDDNAVISPLNSEGKPGKELVIKKG